MPTSVVWVTAETKKKKIKKIKVSPFRNYLKINKILFVFIRNPGLTRDTKTADKKKRIKKRTKKKIKNKHS